MTSSELKAFRAELGLSAAAFAVLLRVGDGRTVRRWESGESPLPGPVALIMEAARVVPQFRRWLANQSASIL